MGVYIKSNANLGVRRGGQGEPFFNWSHGVLFSALGPGNRVGIEKGGELHIHRPIGFRQD
jgi:hypothetical protein